MNQFTLEQKRACLTREIAMRVRVYPKWVAAKKMGAENAQREIDTMSAILKDYYKYVEAEKSQQEMKIDALLTCASTLEKMAKELRIQASNES